MFAGSATSQVTSVAIARMRPTPETIREADGSLSGIRNGSRRAKAAMAKAAMARAVVALALAKARAKARKARARARALGIDGAYSMRRKHSPSFRVLLSSGM